MTRWWNDPLTLECGLLGVAAVLALIGWLHDWWQK